MILFEPSAKAKKDIEDIRAAYKSKFKQDSVMRIDDKHCVSFWIRDIINYAPKIN